MVQPVLKTTVNILLVAGLLMLQGCLWDRCGGDVFVVTGTENRRFTGDELARAAWPGPDAGISGAITWKQAAPGMRMGKLVLGREYGVSEFSLVLLEIDPDLVEMTVHYSEERRYCGQWLRNLGLNACINGSLFASKPLGLVIHDGKIEVTRHRRMLGYLVAPKDGRPRVLVGKSFAAGDIREAVQSFPALIRDGEILDSVRGTSPRRDRFDSDVAARRTVVGEDDKGHLLFAVTDTLTGGLSFSELATLLGALGWKQAVCLDGGASAQLSLETELLRSDVTGVDPVPVIIGLRLRNPGALPPETRPAADPADTEPVAEEPPREIP